MSGKACRNSFETLWPRTACVGSLFAELPLPLVMQHVDNVLLLSWGVCMMSTVEETSQTPLSNWDHREWTGGKEKKKKELLHSFWRGVAAYETLTKRRDLPQSQPREMRKRKFICLRWRPREVPLNDPTGKATIWFYTLLMPRRHRDRQKICYWQTRCVDLRLLCCGHHLLAVSQQLSPTGWIMQWRYRY